MSATTPRSPGEEGRRPLWRHSATLTGGRQIRRTTWRCAWVALLCGALVASFVLVASGAQAAPLTDCVSSDNGDPVMTGVTISPPVVDVSDGPQTVTITAAAEDTGGPGPASGLRKVQVSLRHSPQQLEWVTLALDPSGDWVGTFTVPRWTRGGVWRVDQAFLRDMAGQWNLYGGEAPMSFGASFTVTPAGDTTKPSLTHLSFTPDSVDTTHRARSITFTAKARDDQSGVASVRVYLRSRVSRFAVASLTKQAGAAHTYRGKATIPQWIHSGPWRVLGVWVRDQAANDKFYLGSALDRMGIKRDLDVVSSPDRTHPTLVSYRRTPSAVDVRTADQQVTVTVHAKDTGAGVRRVFADFFGGRFSHFKALERVSGTPQDGLWRGTVRIRECPAATLTLSGSVWLSDARGNGEFVSPRVLRQRGWPSSVWVSARDDAMRPRVHATYHVPLAGPIVLTFNEAVNGLTDSSVTVRQIDVFDSSPPGPVIPGELVCKKASGTVTSCAEGLVRSATFRPSEAFEQGRYFMVELNPEHSLEARDLAGNPFDRNGVIVTTDITKTDSARAHLPRLEPPARVSSPGLPAPLLR